MTNDVEYCHLAKKKKNVGLNQHVFNTLWIFQKIKFGKWAACCSLSLK